MGNDPEEWAGPRCTELGAPPPPKPAIHSRGPGRLACPWPGRSEKWTLRSLAATDARKANF